jgi:hypothetical protein
METLPQTESVEEAVQEKDAAIPGQVIASEGDTDTPEASSMSHARALEGEIVSVR